MKNTKRGTPDPNPGKKTKTLTHPQVAKEIKYFAATRWRKKVPQHAD